MKIEIPNQEICEAIAKYARTKIVASDNFDAHVKIRTKSTIVTFTERANGISDLGSGASGLGDTSDVTPGETA